MALDEVDAIVEEVVAADAKAELDVVMATLDGCEEVNFAISAHTDSVDVMEANARLSEQSASSVASYLVRRGIARQ